MSIYSVAKYISLKLLISFGFCTSTIFIIQGWFKKYNNFISLTILLASIKSSNAFWTFFIATKIFFSLSRHEQTKPYEPWPNFFTTEYFLSIINVFPAISKTVLSGFAAWIASISSFVFELSGLLSSFCFDFFLDDFFIEFINFKLIFILFRNYNYSNYNI